ncbi:Hypothetical protein PEIBARAKI_6992 [Petrimonas sp. IBARAKI]|nr:Hypothetical protein PEIBARAKI_6992 [Petrimonas sp. IBARAKI]
MTPLLIWSQNVEYQHDVAGNVKSRKVIITTKSAQTVIPDTTVQVIRDIIDKKEIKIYPNPTTDIINIKINNYNPDNLLKITFFDLSGRLLISKMVREETTTLDVSPYAGGIYILRLQGKGIYSDWRIIKR